MMAETKPMWDEIEAKVGKKLLLSRGILNFGDPKDKEFQDLWANKTSKDEILDAKDIMKRWPAMDVPHHFKGVWSLDGGVTMAKEALMAVK